MCNSNSINSSVIPHMDTAPSTLGGNQVFPTSTPAHFWNLIPRCPPPVQHWPAECEPSSRLLEPALPPSLQLPSKIWSVTWKRRGKKWTIIQNIKIGTRNGFESWVNLWVSGWSLWVKCESLIVASWVECKGSDLSLSKSAKGWATQVESPSLRIRI